MSLKCNVSLNLLVKDCKFSKLVEYYSDTNGSSMRLESVINRMENESHQGIKQWDRLQMISVDVNEMCKQSGPADGDGQTDSSIDSSESQADVDEDSEQHEYTFSQSVIGDEQAFMTKQNTLTRSEESKVTPIDTVSFGKISLDQEDTAPTGRSYNKDYDYSVKAKQVYDTDQFLMETIPNSISGKVGSERILMEHVEENDIIIVPGMDTNINIHSFS